MSEDQAMDLDALHGFAAGAWLDFQLAFGACLAGVENVGELKERALRLQRQVATLTGAVLEIGD